MATNAELEAALKASREEFAKFRKTVVDQARKSAKNYGWCGEVDNVLRKVGLGDLLPPVYIIEEKNSARGRWKEAEQDPYSNKVVAINDAKSFAVPQHSGVYVGTVGPHNVDRVKSILDKFEAKSFSPPAYPRFRVVKRGGTDEVVFSTNAD